MSRSRPGVGWLSPGRLVAAVVAGIGVVVSTVATRLALDAGEPPATLVPGTGPLVPSELPAIVIVRVAALVALAVVVARWRRRYLAHALAGAGGVLVLLGVWQAWLLLART